VTSHVAGHSSVASAGGDLLAAIVAAARRIVDVREARESRTALEERAARVDRVPKQLLSALTELNRVNVIAECKRRSPSRGVLREVYDPAAIARGYAEAGAAAISVVTEPTFFDGALEHLQAVRAAVETPLLRKDFIVSEYQVLEAKAAGADGVLLIVAALQPGEVASLIGYAKTLGLDALVEVHDEDEVAIALAAGARIVGVNNRNLRTLAVDVEASARLIGRIPEDVVAVSESGLRTAEDLARLQALGFRAFLIGERFMGESDPGAALRSLLGGASSAPTGVGSSSTGVDATRTDVGVELARPKDTKARC
jgi:indole-3-glycerol phosphate synthase